MRLMRLVGHQELGGSTAGLWLVPGQGLLVQRCHGGWKVEVTPWLNTHQQHPHPQSRFLQTRARWMIRHGLDRAQFPRRRDAAGELERLLQLDPPPPAPLPPSPVVGEDGAFATDALDRPTG